MTDLEQVLMVAKWVVGICAPIVSGMAFAIYKLWHRGNEQADKHAERLELMDMAHSKQIIVLGEKHATELKEVWDTTREFAVEQGKVISRLTNKIGGDNGQ